MPYATPQDMLERYGETRLAQFCDRGAARTSVVDSAVLTTALADSSALIDGYLMGRYNLPLVPVPPAIKVHCCQLANYQLQSVAADERSQADYEATLKYLSLVAEGKVLLVAPTQQQPLAGGASVAFNTGSKIFGREA